MLSANEVETTLRKAAAGAGVSYGLAEDLGRAAAFLALRELDGIATALEALQEPEVPPSASRDDGCWTIAAAPVTSAGPAAFDLLAAGAARVELRDVRQPLLLLGLAGVAAGDFGTGFHFRFADGTEASVACGRLDAPAAPPRGPVVVTAVPVAPAAAAPQVTRQIAVDPCLWRRVLAAAALSTVPASEASRSRGAGAGLLDND